LPYVEFSDNIQGPYTFLETQTALHLLKIVSGCPWWVSSLLIPT